MAGVYLAIAIDGPAASGKSSVAKAVARRFGFNFVSSGGMYRAFTWHVLRSNVDPNDAKAVVRLLRITEFQCGVKDGVGTIAVNGDDVTPYLSHESVNGGVSAVAAIPEVRTRLVAEQRRYLDVANVVMEGRDIGTVVFADTPYKYFLDASPEVRAKRRQAEGILDDINERDRKDSTRETAPLKVADDATVIDTSYMTLDEVVDKVCELMTKAGVEPEPQAQEEYVPEKFKPVYWTGYTLSSFFTKGLYNMRVFNKEKTRVPGGCLIAANHMSYLDPPVVGTAFDEPIYYVARQTLFNTKFSGWLLPRCNAIPLNQDNPDLKTLRGIINSVKKDGKKVLIFPEGTRSPDGDFLPAQRGVGMLISKMRAPVIPARVFGTFEIFPRNAKGLNLRGKIYVVFGDPIYFSEEELNAKGKEAYQALSDKTLERIKALQLPPGA